MRVLGFDTATSSTAVGLGLPDGRILEARDDPAPGAHPGHATRLLELARRLLGEAGIGWGELDRLAVGTGPGTFTGLRVGVATARGLSQSLGLELVGVSSSEALAHGALPASSGGILAVIDARRGEVFLAAFSGAGRRLLEPRALAPQRIAETLSQTGLAGPWLAVGDGALRYREELEAAGARLPPEGDRLHLISGRSICELGSAAAPLAGTEQLLPDYRRRPDAELASAGSAPAGVGAP